MAQPLSTQIETVLFVAGKPLSVKKLAKLLLVADGAVREALAELQHKYPLESSGVVLLENSDEWQLVSHPDNKTLAENFVKGELTGELTRPQLETLTVISYCGPITKPELEQIRGVNCSLILRNLLMRNLIRTSEEQELLPRYEVTMDFVSHLGLQRLSDLPDYAELHNHQYITATLQKEQMQE